MKLSALRCALLHSADWSRKKTMVHSKIEFALLAATVFVALVGASAQQQGQ